MGGSSRSKASNVTTNNSTNVGGDINGISIGSGSTTGDIVVSDMGAIDSSFEFATEFGEQMGELGGKALDVGGGLASQALDNSQRLSEQAMGSVASQTGTVANYMRDVAKQVGELAHSFQSGGESDRNKVYMYAAGAGFAALVLVVVAMSWGKK